MENQENNNIEKKEEFVLNESNVNNTPVVNIDESAKNARKKIDKTKKLMIILFSIIGIIIVIFALFLVFRRFNKMKIVEYNEEYTLYQYFSGVKTSYTGKITITNEGDITKIESSEGVNDINDAPVYFQDDNNKVLTPKNMQLVIPRLLNKNYKLKYFTEISYDKDTNSSYFLQGKENVFLDKSFLYDGNNLYLFLNEVSVNANDKVYNLSPLSYLIVNYQGEVEIYDKEKDEYVVIDLCEKDVIGNMDEYVINLSTDTVSNGETSRLLVKSVDNLELYKSSN